jgi:hypothetical protein
MGLFLRDVDLGNWRGLAWDFEEYVEVPIDQSGKEIGKR